MRVGATLKRLSIKKVAVLGVVILLLVAGTYKALTIGRLVRSLQAELDTLEAATKGEGEQDLRALGDSLRRMHHDLRALKSQIGFALPLMGHLGWVPGVGGDLEAAPALMDVALSVSEAGVVTLDELEPLIAMTEGESHSKDPPLTVALKTLSDARPAMESAQVHLDTAASRRADIDTAKLSPRTADMLARLDRYLPLMQTALDAAAMLPDLLGASGRRTYLVLAQNNDELRATGGFISAVGTLTLEEGEIGEIVFEDSYVVDDFSHPYPDSPAPLLQYMGIDQWVFRDANWSPDWPTSAQKAIELYRISRELDVDGVIAVDQYVLQAIVAAMAPLQIEGWPEPVTGDNVVSLIRMAWSPTEVENWQGWDPQWWAQRKQFIGDLVGVLRQKLETHPDQVDWLTLARAVLRVLDERHLLVWLADEQSPAAQLLAQQGWDGAIRPTRGDYLMVVESNLGYNKANAAVASRLDYHVLVGADGSAQATLTIQHIHHGTPAEGCDHKPRYGQDYDDLINRCYWNYLRVYAPKNSQLSAATRHRVPTDWLITHQPEPTPAEEVLTEKDKTVLATFFVLPRGAELESRFVYQLPAGMLRQQNGQWVYQLLVQKQAGVEAVPLRVTLALPPGAVILDTSLDGVDGTSAIQILGPDAVVFDTTLKTDKIVQVTFQMSDREKR